MNEKLIYYSISLIINKIKILKVPKVQLHFSNYTTLIKLIPERIWTWSFYSVVLNPQSSTLRVVWCLPKAGVRYTSAGVAQGHGGGTLYWTTCITGYPCMVDEDGSDNFTQCEFNSKHSFSSSSVYYWTWPRSIHHTSTTGKVVSVVPPLLFCLLQFHFSISLWLKALSHCTPCSVCHSSHRQSPPPPPQYTLSAVSSFKNFSHYL